MQDVVDLVFSPVADSYRDEVGFPHASKRIRSLAHAWGFHVVEVDLQSGVEYAKRTTIPIDRNSSPYEQAEQIAHRLAMHALTRVVRTPSPQALRLVASELLCPRRRFVSDLSGHAWDLRAYSVEWGIELLAVARRAAEAARMVITIVRPPETAMRLDGAGLAHDYRPGSAVMAAAERCLRLRSDAAFTPAVRSYWEPYGTASRAIVAVLSGW